MYVLHSHEWNAIYSSRRLIGPDQLGTNFLINLHVHVYTSDFRFSPLCLRPKVGLLNDEYLLSSESNTYFQTCFN